MKSLQVHILTLVASIVLLLQACGTSHTNGSLTVADLTMTDLTGGYYSASTTVTYTPPSGKDPNGTKVNVSTVFTRYSGANSVEKTKTQSTTETLDSTGSFSYTRGPISQGSSPVFVTITASTGDLQSSKLGSVPAIAALSATPSSIVFASTDTAGTTKTVTLSGGYTPYQAPIVTDKDGNNITDITASINDTTMTVVLVTPNTGSTKPAKITVFDAKGNSVVIGVTY